MNAGLKFVYLGLLSGAEVEAVQIYKKRGLYNKKYFFNVVFFDGFSSVTTAWGQKIQMHNDTFGMHLIRPYNPDFIDKIRLLLKKDYFKNIKVKERKYLDVSMLI